jgi:hypothetical protein
MTFLRFPTKIPMFIGCLGLSIPSATLSVVVTPPPQRMGGPERGKRPLSENWEIMTTEVTKVRHLWKVAKHTGTVRIT